jgi:peptidoglycan/LPS O-acetylase OafA/YrhL
MGEIRSHTGLRGVAAFFVVFYHLQFTHPHLPFEDATSIFKQSYLMVDLFFILSGFIISYVYSDQMAQGLSYISFMKKRLIRLFPLHLCCLFVLVFGLVTQNAALDLLGKDSRPIFTQESTTALISQLFLLNAWFPKDGTWNIPSWSISAEIFAYALYPTLLFMLSHRRIIGALGLLLLSLIFYGSVGYFDGSLDITSGWAPMRCLAGFALGMLVHSYRNGLLELTSGGLGALQFISFLGSIMTLSLPMNDVFAIPFFVLLVYSLWTDKGWLSELLAQRVFQYLGHISYSVYLTHVVILTLLYPTWTAIASRLTLDPLSLRGLWIFVVLVVVLVSSHFTYHWVEEPSRRWLTRRLVPN